MKKLLITAVLFLSTAGMAHAGSIRVYNNDSRAHTVELKCSGSSKSFEIKASTTTTYTFHSTSKSCDIVGGTIKWPTRTMEDGKSWKIKNGEAKPN